MFCATTCRLTRRFTPKTNIHFPSWAYINLPNPSTPNKHSIHLRPHIQDSLRLTRFLASNLQCDEAHPVCRNCVKSKRECLGYDPVFRSQPAPSAIQPAPNPPPSLVVAPQNPSSYPPIPAGYVAASAAPPLVTSLPSESPTPSLGPLEHATSVDFLHHTSNSPPAPPTQNPTEGNSQHQATPVPPPPVPAAIPPMPPAMPPPNPPGQKSTFFSLFSFSLGFLCFLNKLTIYLQLKKLTRLTSCVSAESHHLQSFRSSQSNRPGLRKLKLCS